MSRNNIIRENPHESFLCSFCHSAVPPVMSGGNHRNHCHQCLHSLHVDIVPGDRKSACRGLMKPISVWIRRDGEWSLIHRCEKCGTIRTNRLAANDNEGVLLSMAISFITRLPFPPERILNLLGKETKGDYLYE
jgi:hypothetical protein